MSISWVMSSLFVTTRTKGRAGLDLELRRHELVLLHRQRDLRPAPWAAAGGADAPTANSTTTRDPCRPCHATLHGTVLAVAPCGPMCRAAARASTPSCSGDAPSLTPPSAVAPTRLHHRSSRSLAGQLDEGVGQGRLSRLLDQLGRRALGTSRPRCSTSDPVGPLRLVHEVRRPEHAQRAVPAERVDVGQQGPARRRIEAHGRLVEDQDARLVQERPRQLDLAAVAAAQRATARRPPRPGRSARAPRRCGPRPARGEARGAARGSGGSPRRSGRGPASAAGRRRRAGPARATRCRRMSSPSITMRPRSADEEPGQDLEEGGLARAVRAQQRHELAGPHRRASRRRAPSGRRTTCSGPRPGAAARS